MLTIKNVTMKHLNECLEALYTSENIDVEEGSLLDNYNIDKDDINFNVDNEFINFIRKFKTKFDTIEFKEIVLNSWESGYIA